MTRRKRLGFVALLPFYVALATALGFVDYHVRPHPANAYESYVPSVVHGTADPPARYRVLAPALADRLTALSGLRPDDGWILFRWLCLLAALCAGHLWYRTWFSAGGALAGNALVMALMPLTFTNSWGHPNHFVELCLFTLGCACVARDWRLAFLVVLGLATLNRETSFLLVVVFAISQKWSPARARWIAAAGFVWAAAYVGLRWRLGYVPYNPLHLKENLVLLFWWPMERDLYYRLYSWFFLALLAAPAVMIVRNWGAQPRVLRAGLAVAVPMFVAIGLTFSSVIEPRIFTPLLPLLVAGALFSVFDEERPAASRTDD